MKTKPKTKLQPIIIKEDGIFCIQHYRKGKLLSETKIHNTATAVGKAVVAGLINEATVSPLVIVALRIHRHTLPHGSAVLHQALMTVSAIAVVGPAPAALSQVQVAAVVFLRASVKAVL